MEIVVEKPFGPFENIGGVDLPEFSVFIGLNGSGKTQLLLALKNGHVVARIDGRPVARHNILYIGNQLNAGAMSRSLLI